MLKIAGNVFNLLVVINSSVNFVLYSSFSSKFRMTFRRLFCHRGRLSRCLGGDAGELQWLRDDQDGIEMTYTRVGRAATAVTGGTSPVPQLAGDRRRGKTVIVVATPGGGRTFIMRQKSRDRKELAPTTTVEMAATSQYGLTATTTSSLLTVGGSQSSVSDSSVGIQTAPSEHSDIVPETS